MFVFFVCFITLNTFHKYHQIIKMSFSIYTFKYLNIWECILFENRRYFSFADAVAVNVVCSLWYLKEKKHNLIKYEIQ